jgi:hypothetical protein
MVAVARLFREVLDGRLDAAEGTARLEEMGLGAPLANGFVHKQPGYLMRTGI